MERIEPVRFGRANMWRREFRIWHTYYVLICAAFAKPAGICPLGALEE
jgi:hypothetical protein